MHITTLSQNGVTVVNFVGDLDIHSHLALKKRVREIVGESNGLKVLVDVSGIRRVDSTGLGTLVALLNTARAAGGDLRLAGTFTSEVGEAFNLCGLARVFAIYPSVKDGIQNFEI
jgi:anti-sigma B factor antagonist